jgi:hypothetical protein
MSGRWRIGFPGVPGELQEIAISEGANGFD